MIDRIKLLMKDKNLSAAQFSEAIQVQRSSLSHVLSGRNKPSLDFMLKIKKSFTDINLDWLLLGKGEMVETNESITDPEATLFDKPPPGDELKAAATQSDKKTKEMEVLTTNKDLSDGKELSHKQVKEPSRIIIFYADNSFESYDPR